VTFTTSLGVVNGTLRSAGSIALFRGKARGSSSWWQGLVSPYQDILIILLCSSSAPGGHPEVVQTTLVRTSARISCLSWSSPDSGWQPSLAANSRRCLVQRPRDHVPLSSVHVTSSWSGGVQGRQISSKWCPWWCRDRTWQGGLQTLPSKTSIVTQGVSWRDVDRSRSWQLTGLPLWSPT